MIHIDMSDPQEETFRCDKCGKSFNSRAKSILTRLAFMLLQEESLQLGSGMNQVTITTESSGP
jgi:transposase-like protein